MKSGRVRAGLRTAAVALLLAGCGAAPSQAYVAEPDLLRTLPTPVSTPVPTPVTTTTAPTPTSAGPTSTTRATTTPSTTRTAKKKVPTAAPAPPPPPAPRWNPVGGDEFDGGGLDAGRWATYDGAGGFGNGRRDPAAITQADGLLQITATGADGGRSGGMAHTQGRLHGRWEFRARTDAGRGFGSAILLWPDSENFPIDGEIDIMEVPYETRDLAHFVVHWGAENNIHGGAVPGDYTDWHTFAVEWLPDRITWFVDGVKQYETTDLARIPTTPMHLAIQLDQGPKTDWIPAPDETTPEQVRLQVDWVRVSAPA